DSWVGFYSPDDHHTGAVRVLGFEATNAEPDGQAVARAYLRYLARHPATARNIARKLCVRFVRDEPSLSHVRAVAKAYTDSGTDIKATLRALVDHPDFADSVGAKVRTPSEDAVASYRALDVKAARPTDDGDFAHATAWHTDFMGQRPFDWPRPDGPPDVADAWTSAGRMLNSWSIHRNLAGGWTSGATYRSFEDWLPPLPASLDAVVDHVSRRLLARPATTALKAAVATHQGMARGHTIARLDDLGDWRVDMLLATVLNSPQHMTR
ncbi:MAG: DUF1800 domain-containing protein, partial [Actinomycetota bacterium]|nr:DUF1800 domain-containing protein [Actinomycetota bacterium]